MKELNDFKSLTEAMVVNPNDYGAHKEIGDDFFNGEYSFLEDGMADLVGDIASYGVSQSEAEKLLNDVIKELVQSLGLTEVPKESASDGEKAIWMANAKPMIRAHLKLMGALL